MGPNAIFSRSNVIEVNSTIIMSMMFYYIYQHRDIFFFKTLRWAGHWVFSYLALTDLLFVNERPCIITDPRLFRVLSRILDVETFTMLYIENIIYTALKKMMSLPEMPFEFILNNILFKSVSEDESIRWFKATFSVN